MRPRLFEPLLRIRITDEIEEPLQESESVSSPKTEPVCVRRKAFSEGSWIVDDAAARFGNNLRDRLRVFMLPEQIRRDPRWPRHR